MAGQTLRMNCKILAIKIPLSPKQSKVLFSKPKRYSCLPCTRKNCLLILIADSGGDCLSVQVPGQGGDVRLGNAIIGTGVHGDDEGLFQL